MYICIYFYLCTYVYVYTHRHIYGILRWARFGAQDSKLYLGDLTEKDVLEWLPYSITIQTIFPLGKHCQLLGQGLFLYLHMELFSKGWSLKRNTLSLAGAEASFDWRRIGQVWPLLSHHAGQGSHEAESCKILVASGSL